MKDKDNHVAAKTLKDNPDEHRLPPMLHQISPCPKFSAHRCQSLSVRVFGFFFSTSLLPAATPDFQQDIAPIFRQFCAGCHNDDEPEAELSVETYASLIKGGETQPPIIPGNAKESYLARLLTHQKKPYMPPRKEPQLSPTQIKAILDWINSGAKGPARDTSILANLVTPDFPASKSPPATTAIAYSPDGKFHAEATYRTLHFSNFSHTGLPGKVNALAFSPDSKLLAAGTGTTGLQGSALLYSTTTGKHLQTLSGQQKDIITNLAFAPDGKTLATASYDSTIQLWDTATWTPIHKLTGHTGAVHSVSWAPDNRTLASASADHSIKIWDTQTGYLLDTRSQPTAEQYTVTITPDGEQFIASGADKQIRIWQLLSKGNPVINPLLQVRFAHEEEIISHKLSKDGKILTTYSTSGTTKDWSLPGLAQIGNLPRPTTQQLPTKPKPLPLPNKILSLPAKEEAVLDTPYHLYAFKAIGGQPWIFEIKAARGKSPLDSKLEILHPDGNPVSQIRLQASRDSWLTFRGKDSKTSGDFRLFKQEEMTLNQLLYINGEVIKLWHYPRGPDSGYIVYPGYGDRHTLYGTTPLAHPLGQPAYIVRPLGRYEQPKPNGLPVFDIPFENDDDPNRLNGKDSLLTFSAPLSGSYLVRVSDIRGQYGKNYKYTLEVREPNPRFTLTTNQFKDGIPKGAGREISFKATRLDNYAGPIRIDIAKPPCGFTVTTPLIIQPGQTMAYGTIHADKDAPEPTIHELAVTASATINEKEYTTDAPAIQNLKLLGPPKLQVRIEPQVLTIRPGQTVSAKAFLTRTDFNNRVSLGSHDAGRNLPHGVYVDNIGLNGLLLPEGQTEREFFITCDKWVTPGTTRKFHLKTSEENGIASLPVRLVVEGK